MGQSEAREEGRDKERERHREREKRVESKYPISFTRLWGRLEAIVTI